MDSERSEIARRVLRALRHESGRTPMTATDAEGNRPVVIALGRDTVIETVSRVVQVGGAATVVVPDEVGRIVPLTMELGPEHPGQTPYDIHPDSTMAVLVSYLAASGESVTHWRITTPVGDVDVQEGARQLLVPA